MKKKYYIFKYKKFVFVLDIKNKKVQKFTKDYFFLHYDVNSDYIILEDFYEYKR